MIDALASFFDIAAMRSSWRFSISRHVSSRLSLPSIGRGRGLELPAATSVATSSGPSQSPQRVYSSRVSDGALPLRTCFSSASNALMKASLGQTHFRRS